MKYFFKTRGGRISISLSFSRYSLSSWGWWCAWQEETADLCDGRPSHCRLHVHLHRLLLGCKKGDRLHGEFSSLRKWLQLLSQLPPLPQVLLVTSHFAYFWHCRITISHILKSPWKIFDIIAPSSHIIFLTSSCPRCDLIGCRVNSECRHCSKCKNCLANGFCGKVCGVRNLPQQMQLYGQDC